MAGNIKLEIIYFKTEPDAALEFGLQGNFAVRILSSRVQNAAGLVGALKKASVRNEFIVVVGGFEDGAVTGVIAKAIGRELVPAAQYMNGQPDGGLSVPADAIPLVAENGALCGAVIESGFQSILLLSGDGQQRELVLKPLLLPYLNERYSEIHASQAAEESAAIAPAEPLPAMEGNAPAQAMPEQSQAAPVPETEISPIEPAQTPDTQASQTELPPAVEEAGEKWQNFIIEDLPEPEDADALPPKKKRRVWLVLLIVFLSVALVIGSAFSYLFYFVPWQNGRKTEEFAALYQRDVSLSELRGINSRATGWLQMQSAGIETPVVFAGEDSNYDRYHLLDGTLNPIGTPYVGAEIRRFEGVYIVRMDGYYTQLCQYLDADFTESNRQLRFDSLTHTARWRVFSAFTFGKEPAFDYLKDDFADAAEYAKQLRILTNASEIGKSITVEDTDTVAVFTATRFGKTVTVAALLIDQAENGAVVPTVTPPEEQMPSSSSAASSEESSAASSAGATSSGPVIDYTAEDNKVDLVDKVEDEAELPPLSDSEIEDNLNIPKPPVSSSPPSSSSASSGTASGGQTVTITGTNVNVRAGAGTGYTRLGYAEPGKAYAYLGSAKDSKGGVWYKIQYTPQRAGYVTSQYAALNGAGGSSSTASSSPSSSASSSTASGSGDLVVTVLSNGVNVRAGAGTSYEKLGMVNMGQVFAYLSERKTGSELWYSFQYTADKVGWIRSDFALKAEENNAPTEGNIASGNVVLTVKNGGNVLKGTALDIVASVIEAEMGSGYPMEALKAQAVATYSFLLVRGAAKGTPVVAPMKIPGARCRQAAKDVLGQCAYYNGKVAQTYYYAISAGYTANCQDIWTAKLPYLVAVESAPDSGEKGFATTVTLTPDEIKQKLNAKYEKSYPQGLPFDSVPKEKWFVCTYDQNNAYCKTILIANKLQTKGNSIYGTLGLRSGAYTITYNAENDTFTFHVRGHGHGVGLSQVGAKGYANQGWDYKKILQHYYRGVVIK